MVNTAFGGFFDLALEIEPEFKNTELINHYGEKQRSERADTERRYRRRIEESAHAVFCADGAKRGKKNGRLGQKE